MAADPEIIGVSGAVRLANVSFKHGPSAVNSPGRAVRYICASQRPSSLMSYCAHVWQVFSQLVVRELLCERSQTRGGKLPEVPGYTLDHEGRQTVLWSGLRDHWRQRVAAFAISTAVYDYSKTQCAGPGSRVGQPADALWFSAQLNCLG